MIFHLIPLTGSKISMLISYNIPLFPLLLTNLSLIKNTTLPLLHSNAKSEPRKSPRQSRDVYSLPLYNLNSVKFHIPLQTLEHPVQLLSILLSFVNPWILPIFILLTICYLLSNSVSSVNLLIFLLISSIRLKLSWPDQEFLRKYTQEIHSFPPPIFSQMIIMLTANFSSSTLKLMLFQWW